MGGFWKLLGQSIILRGMLAVMFGGTACYMYIVGIEVPDALVSMLMLILGSFFQAAVNSRARGGE